MNGFRFPHFRNTCIQALTLVAALPVAAAQLTDDYEELDNVAGSMVKLASFPVRPMELVGEEDLWVVNHHDSKVERFGLSTHTHDVFDVPWDPVSIAYWQGTTSSSEDDQMVVTCRGSWTIVGLDYQTGEIVWLIQTRPGTPNTDSRIGQMAEPADLVIDSTLDSPGRHRAFVSCPGADSVLQINLASTPPAIVRVFSEANENALANGSTFRCKAPLFLSLDRSFSPPHVLVAPLVSGNNSTWGKNLTAGTKVLDLSASGVVYQGNRLPDEDLFKIQPYRSGASPGRVSVVGKRTGTLLFAQGINEVTDEFWQLNTDANNKDPLLQGEPDVTGRFSFNRITFLPRPFVTEELEGGLPAQGMPNPGWSARSLDPSGMNPPDSPTVGADETVGQPFALAFNGYGQAFVTGLLTDNVAMFAPDHSLLLEWNLTDPSSTANARAIPRGVVVGSTLGEQNGSVFVYCWGLNEVREYAYDLMLLPVSASLANTYTLSNDPTSTLVKEGRSLFFDGRKSEHKNLSCASCHVEGGSDFLTWNLSNSPHSSGTDNEPIDDKGGMFTQTLVGLRRLAPFHWRGERQLVDFNKKAFTGLLGSTTGPLQETDTTHAYPQDFDRFEAFVMSLTNPANPNEDRERVVSKAVDFPGVNGDARDGQQKFREESAFFKNDMRCIDCHHGITGTGNDINVEQEIDSRPRRTHLKAAPFHEVWRKLQSRVNVKFPPSTSTPEPMAFLGSGLGHVGGFPDLLAFVDSVTRDFTNPISDPADPSGSAASEAERQVNIADIASFIHQWDQGVAPAVHYAYLLDSNSTTATAELVTYLQAQAQLGNCDIAVFGTVQQGGSAVHARWVYNANTGRFYSDKPSVLGPRWMSDFISPAATPESNVFIGLPLGMGERFAIDYDLDGLANQDESASQRNVPNPDVTDTTPPTISYVGAHPVEWTTSRVARVRFTTDEPSKAIVRYWPAACPTEIFEVASDGYSTHHALMLTQLKPSTVVGYPADPVFGSVDMTYEMEIEVKDLETNSDVVPIEGTFKTKPFSTPFSGEVDVVSSPNTRFQPYGDDSTGTPLPSPDHRNILHEHILTALAVNARPGTSGVDVTITAQVDFKRGGYYTSSGFQLQPAEDRIIIGHLLKRDASGDVTLLDTAQVFSTTTPHIDSMDALGVRDVRLVSSSGGVLEVIGDPSMTGNFPFVVTKVPSNSSGSVSMDFNLASSVGVSSGDEVVFAVDAVVEIFDPGPTTWSSQLAAAGPSGSHPGIIYLTTQNPYMIDFGPLDVDLDFGARRPFQVWSFPDTTEDNAFDADVVE